MSRDCDTVMTRREVEAVRHWLTESEATFHMMRDHQMHCEAEILAGIFVHSILSHQQLIQFFLLINDDRRLGCQNLPETSVYFSDCTRDVLRRNAFATVRIRPGSATQIYRAFNLQRLGTLYTADASIFVSHLNKEFFNSFFV